MAPKALVEEVKLLNKVKEEEEKNQSLTTKQLAALVVCRNAPYMTGKKMIQGCVSNMMSR